MQFTDPNNPNEKKKLIAAGVLGLAAILLLGYVFFGGSSKTTTPAKRNLAAQTPTPLRGVKDADKQIDDPSTYREIIYTGVAPPMSEPNRNIFAYYEPPPKPSPEIRIPSPTPTPVPPLTPCTIAV